MPIQKNQLYHPDRINNFQELVKRYGIYGDSIAFRYKKNPKDRSVIDITYQQFKEDIEGLATALLKQGLQGKRIALIAPNRYEWCTSYLAIQIAGGIVVPLDKALPDGEIEGLIIRSKVEAVIYDQKYEAIFEQIKSKKESRLHTYISMDLEKKQEDIESYQEWVKRGRKLKEQGDTSLENIKIEEDKMSILLFTSGTTAISKAVQLSQKNICENIYVIGCTCKVVPEDVFLSFLPLHHTFESTTTFLYGTFCGITVAFCDGLRYIGENLKEYQVTGMVCVPIMLEAMYKKIQKGIEKEGKTKLVQTMRKVCNGLLKVKIDIRRKVFHSILEQLGGKLRVIVYGAAPADKQTIEGLTDLGINLLQGYGLTETSPVIAAENDRYKKPGSCGFPMPNAQIKIMDPDSQGVGEIAVKGTSVMLGYLENEEATKEVLQDGWFFTGDLGYFDEDGYLFVTGRKKDVLVLKNGKNVYPQELEMLVAKLPFVLENMVYGRKEEDGDLKIGVKIVYDPEILNNCNQEGIEEETYIWKEIKKINKTMPAYKCIRELIITQEPMIKTTTQKIKRHEEMKKIISEKGNL